jgi:hypothetical protein
VRVHRELARVGTMIPELYMFAKYYPQCGPLKHKWSDLSSQRQRRDCAGPVRKYRRSAGQYLSQLYLDLRHWTPQRGTGATNTLLSPHEYWRVFKSPAEIPPNGILVARNHAHACRWWWETRRIAALTLKIRLPTTLCRDKDRILGV